MMKTEVPTAPNWSTIKEYRKPEDYLLGPNKTWTAAESEGIWIRDNSVSYHRSVQLKGINRHSGKPFSRWRKESILNVRRTSTGKIVIVSIDHERGKRRFQPPGEALHTFERSPEVFKKEVYAKFGDVSESTLYPLLPEKYSYYVVEYVPAGQYGFYRSADIQEFTRASFGKKQYRKDLVKAVAVSHPFLRAVARQFRGLAPVDWIVGFMNTNRSAVTGSGAFTSPETLRPLLKLLDRNSIRGLLTDQTTAMISGDCIHMFRRIKARGHTLIPSDFDGFRVRSWTDLHQALVSISNGETAAQREEERKRLIKVKAKQTELTQILDGKVVNGQRLYLAKNAAELTDWGVEFGTCIGGYGSRMAAGISILGAIFEGEKMLVNFEIADGELRQFLGKHNRSVDADIKQPWYDLFHEYGVRTDSRLSWV